MAQVYLSLGTNIGDRGENLRKCLMLLNDRSVEVIRSSTVYETAPWGFEDQPAFFNQAAEVTTSLSPLELLKAIKGVEKLMGRKDLGRWKERLIDIDILYYDDLVFQNQHLTIPHPDLHSRKFVLHPLCEIAGEYIHPILIKSNNALLEECMDNLMVRAVRTGDK